MCMSRPGRVVRLSDGMAEVERGGRRTWFNALPVPEAAAGDWVLTHAGLVIAVITEAEAAEVDALHRETGEGDLG